MFGPIVMSDKPMSLRMTLFPRQDFVLFSTRHSEVLQNIKFVTAMQELTDLELETMDVFASVLLLLD
jgi:hypothetical protein